MPQYFPLPPRIVTVEVEVGGAGGVNIETEDAFDVAGAPVAVLEVPDSVDASDLLAEVTITPDDTVDGADLMEVSGTVTADDTVVVAGAPVGSLLVPDTAQIGSVLGAGAVALGDYISVTPRIASALIDFGEVVSFSGDTGRGLLKMNSQTAGTGLYRCDEASPTSVNFISAGDAGATFRSNNDALNSNAQMVACGFRLSSMKGIRWQGGIGHLADSFVFSSCDNDSTLQVADATLYAALFTEGTVPWNTSLTWSNISPLRSRLSAISASQEAEASGDVTAANPITGSVGDTRFMQDPFDFTVAKNDNGVNLWVVWWQDETFLLDSLSIRVAARVEAWVEFSILPI
jgi:hypothetical protein